MKKNALISLFFCLGLAFLNAGNLEADKLLSEGIAHYNEGRYQPALEKLLLIVQSPYFIEYYPVANYMLAKTYLAMGNNKKAAEHVEYFLLKYKEHPYFQEVYYLKGLVLFRQGDLKNAILSAEDFLARYPTSVFVPNAYFVIGESLYNLGQLDKAFKIYQYIIERYPASNRIEAAQFRLSLISFKRREEELLKLLKWSYEDYLKIIEEYKQKELTYEQALTAYQKKMVDSSSQTTSQNAKTLEVKLAENALQIKELEDKIKKLEEDLNYWKAKASGIITPETDNKALIEELQKRQEILEMKEKALAIKEAYLKWLQNYLENKP